MSEILSKLNNQILKEFPKIDKEIFDFLYRIESAFEADKGHLIVFSNEHGGYYPVDRLYIEDENDVDDDDENREEKLFIQLVLKDENGNDLLTTLSQLQPSGILLIYEYIMDSI